MGRKKIDRMDEIGYNNFGNKMRIILYNNANDITVKFDNGYITKSRYDVFKAKQIKSPYDKTVENLGYLGEGKYIDLSSDSYSKWNNMVLRCYSKVEHKRYPHYKDCIICEEWLNYQNFAQWYEENFYQIDNEVMCLDKDILHKGNKIYSPITCVFVPERINLLFCKSDKARGDLPIGVNKDKNNKYIARCSNCETRVYLGYFSDPIQAYNTYKTYKENLIKQIADEYRDKIPKNLYNALYSYEVEITD